MAFLAHETYSSGLHIRSRVVDAPRRKDTEASHCQLFLQWLGSHDAMMLRPILRAGGSRYCIVGGLCDCLEAFDAREEDEGIHT